MRLRSLLSIPALVRWRAVSPLGKVDDGTSIVYTFAVDVTTPIVARQESPPTPAAATIAFLIPGDMFFSFLFARATSKFNADERKDSGV